MFKCVVFSVLLLSLSATMVEAVMSFKESLNSESNEAASKIVNLLTPDSLVSLILPPNPLTCQMETLLEGIFRRHQILITQLQTPTPTRNILSVYPDVFVVFIDGYQKVSQLQSILTLSIRTRLWNPAAKFLLIVSVITKSNFKESSLALETFNLLWQRNVFKTLIVVWDKDNFRKEKVGVFSSAPFSKLLGTCKEVTSSKQLQELSLDFNNLSTTSFTGFTFEEPRYFSGCPITGYTVDTIPPYTVAEKSKDLVYKSGIDIELLKLLAELYNFSLEIRIEKSDRHAYLYFLKNGTSLLEDLINYKIELVFGGMKPPSDNHFEIDITHTYGYTSLGWFVPDGEEAAYWSIVVNFLSGTTWLMFFIVCVSFSSLYYLMSGLRDHNNQLFYSLVGALLGTPFNRPPRTCHLRIMLVSWYLFSMHVTIMFSTNLYSVLTHTPMDPGLQTLEQLYQSGLHVCVPQSWKQMYVADPIIRALFRNGLVCNDLEKDVKRFLEKRNFCMIAKADHMNTLVDEKQAKIHQLKNIYSYPVGMTLSKGSILRQLLNRIIFDSMEAGLLHKWVKNVRSEIKVKFSLNKTTRPEYQDRRLVKERFFWAYISLLIGLTLASVALLIEIAYSELIRFSYVI